MKILIIGTTDILGGAAKISWTLKTELEKAGHKATMFVADKRSEDENVHVIPRAKWRKYLGLLLATDELINTDWILDTKEFKEADLIHCHNLHGRFFNLKTLQKMSLLKPLVWTLHDEWAITPHCACTLEGNKIQYGLYTCPNKNTQPRILWNNTKRLAKNKTNIYKNSKLNIVTPSKWLYARVLNTILGQQNLYLIPNGVDNSAFKKINTKEARKKLNLPIDKKIVLFLADGGKNNPWKGWGVAEKITKRFEQENDILFLNVGNFDFPKQEKNIEFRSHIKNTDELSLYYSASDTLLFPSIGENFPLVILEAMSCGLPIVSFDVGGVKEVVTHLENGYIANYKSVEDLKAGLDWIFSLTDEEKEKISSNSITKISENYDKKQMTETYFDLYKKIIPI